MTKNASPIIVSIIDSRLQSTVHSGVQSPGFVLHKLPGMNSLLCNKKENFQEKDY